MAFGAASSCWLRETDWSPVIGTGQEAKRMGSALVSAGLVELALFTMT